jgi:hypothetical protein
MNVQKAMKFERRRKTIFVSINEKTKSIVIRSERGMKKIQNKENTRFTNSPRIPKKRVSF